MKKLNVENTYLEKYDVTVKPFLTYAEIQMIINGMKKYSTWSERETCKDMMTMLYATNVTKEELEEIGHDTLLESGLIDAVRYSIHNFEDIDRGIGYEESLMKTLGVLTTKLPEIADRVKEVTKNGGKSST